VPPVASILTLSHLLPPTAQLIAVKVLSVGVPDPIVNENKPLASVVLEWVSVYTIAPLGEPSKIDNSSPIAWLSNSTPAAFLATPW
jgi:hypothetical protein